MMKKIFSLYNQIGRDKWLKALVLIGLSLLIIIIFAQKTELSSSDLGRHLENGRLVLSSPEILTSNFYSYTEPEHRFINHHWLSGVTFYGLHQLGGFKLLTVFNILLALAIFFIFFHLAAKRSNFLLASLLSLPVIFLMSERTEVRPEMFSYLFLGITWLVLECHSWSRRQKLLILVPLSAVWANAHIYFFLGLALVFCYAAGDFMSEFSCRSTGFSSWLIGIKKWLTEGAGSVTNFKTDFKHSWRVAWPALGSALILTATTLLNPNHIRGLLYPLNIFRNYGYQIAENKSIFFLSSLTLNYNFLIFKLLLGLLILSVATGLIFSDKKRWQDWFFAIIIAALALMASRNLAIFGLIAMVIISSSAYQPLRFLINKLFVKLFASDSERERISLAAHISLLLTMVLLVIFLVVDYRGGQLFLKGERGLGLTAGSQDMFLFFSEAELKGPIFNNYDSGSALIFGLPKEEKVFVDNRPEAYSLDFFQKIYLPLQTDRNSWQQARTAYDFKTIVFSHTDSTPWGKTYLSNILKDSEWALIYFDRYYVILVDKMEYDEEFLGKYTLDARAFRQELRFLAAFSSLKAKFNLADLSQAMSQPELAEEIYRQVLIDKPDNVRALLSLAYLYAASPEAADAYKAITYFERVLKQEKRMPGVYNQLGLVYWRLSDYQQAEKYWLKAKRMNRSDQAALDYLVQIEDLKKRDLLPR